MISFRRQFRELSRLFFGRFLENDLICVDGDTRGTLVGIISLLVAPGVFLPFLEYIQFGSAPLCFLPWTTRDLAAVPDKTLHIALSMTVLGLLTVFEWDAMFPDRRDVAVLRPLPVGAGVIFAAKLFALFEFWTIFTLAVDGASSVFFPMAVVYDGSFAQVFWYARSHAIALVSANLFMFLAMIGVQGALITTLGAARFRRVAPYAQFVLIVGILSLFFLSIGLAFGIRMDQAPSRLVDSLPAFWFLGLDEHLLGWRMPLFDHLETHVFPALLGAAGIAALSYLLSYRKSVAAAFTSQDASPRKPGRISEAIGRVYARLALKTDGERAVFSFIWMTVTRSRTHRMVVAAWAAAGVALVFQGITGAIASGSSRWWAELSGPLLPAPIILPLFVVTGLRYAFTIPAELRANWLFQMGCSAPAEYLTGARKAATILVMAPFPVLLPLFVAAWGWKAGGTHVLMGAITAWLLLDIQMAALEKLPFTCSYVPGKANVKSLWMIYILAYLAYVSALSWVFLNVLKSPGRFIWFALGAAVVKAGVRYYRARGAEFDVGLTFDEQPEPAVRTLGLQS